MVAAIPLAAKIATDIGLTTLMTCGVKTLTKPYTLSAASKVGIFVTEIVVTAMVADKANDYIDDFCDKFDNLMKDRKSDKQFKREWTTGGRTYNA